jgi:hypothetical protein
MSSAGDEVAVFTNRRDNTCNVTCQARSDISPLKLMTGGTWEPKRALVSGGGDSKTLSNSPSGSSRV